MPDLCVSNPQLIELEPVQFLAFPSHISVTPVNKVPVMELGHLPRCVWIHTNLYTKQCCLHSENSPWCQVHTKWSISDACMNKHWLISMDYFNASVLRPPPPPAMSALPAVSPATPFPLWPLAPGAGGLDAIYNLLCFLWHCLLEWWSGQSPRHFATCQIKQSAEMFFQVPVIWWLVFVRDLNHVCMV